MSKRNHEITEQPHVSLCLLATTDLHATLLDYDYTKDHRTSAGSLARAASKVSTLRKKNRATLLLDNGDFLQGAAIADVGHAAQKAPIVNPVISAMNLLEYDAVGLGNHEFNLPAEDLRAALKGATFPILCANLHLSQAPGAEIYQDLWRAGLILPVAAEDQFGGKHQLKVGVFSVLPPQVVGWGRLRIHDRLVGEDMVAAAKKQVRFLCDQGADLVVALAHSGIAEQNEKSSEENVALKIACLDGVDAVISGHVHRVFPGQNHGYLSGADAARGTLCGKPAVMPGAHGSHLGQIDLTLVRGEAGWMVSGSKVAVHALAGPSERAEAEDRRVQDLVAQAHEDAVARARLPIGRLVGPVTSYFSMIKDDCASRLVAEAKIAFVQRAVIGTEFERLPVLASVAPLKCGGRAGPTNYVDVPAGDVSLRNVDDIQPYANHVKVVEVAGRDVAEWLEKGFSVYNQLFPDRPDQFLYDPDAPTYNRETIYGLTYRVDLSKPARYAPDGELRDLSARRICNICCRGLQIGPDQRFLLVTNDYRGGGGGKFPGMGYARELPVRHARVRDLLRHHITLNSGRKETDLGSWQFKRLEGVKALFDTGPGAVRYLGIANMPIEPVAFAKGGFDRYRIDFGALPR